MMARLGDVCNIKSGYAFKSEMFTKNDIPIIRIGNITENGLEIDNDICFDESFWNKNKNYRINKDDVLVAMSGATVGKSCINKHSNKLLLNQRVASISGKNGVENKYVYYFVSSPAFMDYILEQSVGCAQPNISIKQLCAIEFYLPNLKEQKEIVGKLDKVYNLIALRREQLSKLDELVKARFIELFEGENFIQSTIGELVASKASSVKKVFLPLDTIKYIDISSIDNKRNVMTGYTEYILKDAPSRAQQHIKKGDILVATVRPNLKNIAITGYDYDNLVASSGFCVLRAEKCLPEYLMAVVCSDDFTNEMSKVVTGANYPAIKDSDIKGYIVSLPPIGLQNEFADFVKQIDKSKFEIQQSLEKLETLKKSLMQQYFI